MKELSINKLKHFLKVKELHQMFDPNMVKTMIK